MKPMSPSTFSSKNKFQRIPIQLVSAIMNSMENLPFDKEDYFHVLDYILDFYRL